MAINIGSLPINTDTGNWIKVRSALSGSSIRATIAKIIEREVSKSKLKWMNDLEIAAAEREMSVQDLWTLILENKPLPEATDHKASIEVQLKQKQDGKLFEKD